ncbi:PhzF family phenazine biosynthesis protein [Paenibacillus sp. PR3]|uniref:PhzF family phenazine biosynthesis protein n=1 Tax=Paenibacillus terricola TaxID=2763503 RepID=A0ABR8MRJ1_9BACL|nr:PhzF family phenazine biosynthesis protein [Paenibacillus terricola]MBD3918543.1 PhzF family phenazine biosynthesis protein [Paenibacillus terricola]
MSSHAFSIQQPGSTVPIWTVDAFTATPFSGNPAAVCLLDVQPLREWMQKVAAEMNLSETAFLRPLEDGMYELRWFTPRVEVDLCGHATLAAAHILYETGRIGEQETARFETKSGVITACRSGGGIKLDFPSEPVSPFSPPDELIEALGFIPRFTGSNRLDYLVEADDEATVRGLKPDMVLLRALNTRGVIVTSRSSATSSYDFVSRAFFPAIGVDEDPVTGSAHCALAPYWAKRLRKDELRAYQASARGGSLTVRLEEDRVILIGQAITVLSGRLFAT